MRRVAVVLMNLGGPDRPEAVQPFLFNLFNDPAIIGLPAILRWPLAKLIAARRAPVARKIYSELGGGSPLLPNTEAQAAALREALSGAATEAPETTWEVFVAMRYWHPLSDACVAAVTAFIPDVVVLLPLYPQFSTTTVASSVDAWRRAAARQGLRADLRTLCCYPTQEGFVEAVSELTAAGLDALGETMTDDAGAGDAPAGPPPRVLFSAHGLPQKVIDGGDPYQWQVEQSAAAVAARLASLRAEWTDLDVVVCYQSRVGPLAWIGPATEEEIVRAGQDNLPVVVVPIAFVSEHSETLVELDIEYRELAEASGVPRYHRVPTVGIQPAFIAGLARLARGALAAEAPVCSQDGGRLCPARWTRCRSGLEA